MITITLLRHAKTAGNLTGRFVGKTDEPLCKEGILFLKEHKYPMADIVFSSPLMRCVETAEYLYPNVPLHIEPLFSECDFGDFEYKNYEELNGNEYYQKWIDSNGILPFPNGDCKEHYKKRCVEGFINSLNKLKGKNFSSIVFVIHGGTIMSILDDVSNPHKDYFNWQCKNGYGFQLKLDLSLWQSGDTKVSEISPFIPEHRNN